MPLDANGIHQYEESEDAATFSALLNRGMGSVSEAVEQLVYASGPHAISGDPAVATSTLMVERVGRQVELWGILTPVTNWGAINALTSPIPVGGIPANCRPAVSRIFYCPSNAGNAQAAWRTTINADGSVQLRCNTATSTQAVHIALGWLAPPV